MALRPWLALVLALGLSGCRRKAPPSSRPDSGRISSDPSLRLRQITEIENRRAGDITDGDITSRDLAIRRAAARALSRIGSTDGTEPMLKLLSDDDPQVVSWAAYGLGFVCRLEGVPEDALVRALVARSVTAPPPSGSPLDPAFAIARALGHCATGEAERTLTAWLEGPRPRAAFAALGLGDIASRRKTLAEPSQIALLAAAAGSATRPPLVEALYPFGRLDHPLPTVEERLAEVARAQLADAKEGRIFAVRALSRAGDRCAPDLGKVLRDASEFDPAERAEAARGLERLAAAGQPALADAIVAIAPAADPVSVTSLATAAFGPLLVALESIRAVPRGDLKKVLFGMANLKLPDQAPPVLVRRVTKLRCQAALALVNAIVDDPVIRKCDPDENGAVGQQALLTVLGRRSVGGARLSLWRTLADSSDVRVREAAIDLLGAHPEIEDVASTIARALESKEPGVVAVAAQVVAGHPDRFAPGRGESERVRKDAKAVAEALSAALDRSFAPDEIETQGALLEAAGAVGLVSAQKRMETFCGNPNPTLREHAARALSLLKGAKTTCAKPAQPIEPATELVHLATAPRKVELVTDVGKLELTIDPSLAPVAATRMLDLLSRGFFTGLVMHRVLPGFIVQFGDPWRDGFGGAGREPLRCETSPVPFEPLDIGVALAGRDTGSSQIFVTLARHPHIDTEYAVIGKASGPWDALAEGDAIREVTVEK
jgi:cyclophilin family peptidyl-prolyl cis-trans isomerase/HEAT repeat protein